LDRLNKARRLRRCRVGPQRKIAYRAIDLHEYAAKGRR
jgi:hypothetical protein